MIRLNEPRLWPVEPLLDLGHNARAICLALHISGSSWATARDHGLTDRQADRAAIRLGVLPHLVWPGWVEAGLTPLDRVWLEQGWRQAWLYREKAAS